MRRRLRLALPLLLLAGEAATPAGATSFVLGTGEVVEGRLVASTRNTLTVLREIGGIRQIAASNLARVEVRSGPGELVSGPLRALDDDRLAIAAGGQKVVWIEGDRLVAEPSPRGSTDALAALKARPPRSAAPGTDIKRTIRPAEAEAAAKPPEAGNVPGVAAPVSRGGGAPDEAAEPRSFRGIVKAAVAAPGGEVPSAVDRAGPPLVRIEASAAEVEEGEGAIDFRFELSHASEQPIRLIYATIDGQAGAGRDFETLRGVLTLAPGETSRTLQATLLDDRESEDPEQFFLFVKPDGQTATIEQKWHTVTIRDDD